MDYSAPASAESVERTIEAVRARGVAVEVVNTKAEALERLRALVPAGASVMTGASVTLREIGFEDLLKTPDQPWKNLKGEIMSEKDPARQSLLRRQAVIAEYFVGSVHAVAETGQLVIASATGSQIGPYAFTSPNVIWVVGTQKITPTVEEGIRRMREYIMPHEEERMRALTGGKAGTMLGKLLIYERESPFTGRKLTLLLVKERVGD